MMGGAERIGQEERRGDFEPSSDEGRKRKAVSKAINMYGMSK